MSLSEEAGPRKDGIVSEERSTGRESKSKARCGACGRLFKEPKLLPCLHSFCSDCIRQLERFTPRPGPPPASEQPAFTVLCPECDSEVELPPSGVEGLVTDHLALDEVFTETLLRNRSVACDLCGDADADKRCEVCCHNLCDFCSQAHRRQKRTCSHTIHSLEDLRCQGRVSRRILCSLHSDQELHLFCESCDLPVCRECAATFHRDHRCRSVQDVIHRYGDCIRELLCGNLHPRVNRLEEELRRVENSEEALQTRTEMLANEVRSFAKAYVSAVETHCRSLLNSLEDLRLQRHNQLLLQRAQLQQALCDVGSSVDFAERLLTCGSEAEILSAKGVTMRRLMTLLEFGYDPDLTIVSNDNGDSICFLPQKIGGHVEGFPVVGVLHAKVVDASKCTVLEEDFLQCVEGQRSEFTLVCRDSAGEQMNKGGDPVLVSIVHTERKNCKIETTVIDNNDGTYGVSYTPREPGSYSAWVCVKAQHVKGSPFSLMVKRKFQHHHGIFHCCSFCSSGGVKEARCGCIGTMPGGFQGCGHGHKGHPGKPHWSCCGNVVESSECVRSLVSSASHRGLLRTVEL